MSETILVTGAAGFIGSHLSEALISTGFNVIGIDNFDPFYNKELKRHNLTALLAKEKFRFIEGNVGDAETLDKAKKVDLVIHLAAKAGVQPSLVNPQAYIHSNIFVTNTLLEWMKEKKIDKFIFASSSSVYGNTTEIPFRETQSTDIAYSPYAFTKKACEVMNYTYHALYGIDIINLRLFTVYGERQRPDLAIHKFVHNMFNKKPIYMYGDGESARDYTYYADTVKGILGALNFIKSKSGIYKIVNLGNNHPVKLADLISTISVVTEIEPIIIQVKKKPGDVDITYANIDCAKELFNYAPLTDLKTGIAKFTEWYRENIFKAKCS